MRGNDISIVFQEPMTSLNPLHTIERQVGEILKVHRGMGETATRKRVLELLDQVGIRDAASRLGAYPHQLSGGQRQRVMIAMALANEPDLFIADEPTTALDVTVQAQILKLLEDLQKQTGMAMLFITHDLGIVRKFAQARRGDDAGAHRRAGVDGDDLHQPAARLHQASAGGGAEGRPAEGRSHRAGGDGGRPDQGVVPDPARVLPQDGRLHQGGRRHRRGGARGADARRGRRIRLRQDDARAGADAADLVGGADRLPRQRHRRAELQGDAADPQRDADRLPGSVRVAQPAHVGRRHRRRGAEGAPAGAHAKRSATPRRRRR